MQYNIKMFKIVCGDTVIGNYDENEKVLKDVVMIQAVPSAAGMQLAILPYGFPYEDSITGSIDAKHFVYEYKKMPEELKQKYIEAKSNIKIASSLDGATGGSGIIL